MNNNILESTLGELLAMIDDVQPTVERAAVEERLIQLAEGKPCRCEMCTE